MKNKLSGIINYLRNKSEFNHLKYQSNELLAYNILNKYMPDKYFIKSSFSISYSTILHILNDILIYRPKKILEFGSGLSTIVLSNAIHDLNLDTVIHTVDSDANWLNIVKNYLSDRSNVKFHNCPIVDFDVKMYKKYYDIYSNPVLNSIDDFDMYIIDGPWSRITPNVRYGAVDFILSRKRNDKNLIIYVDDINRKDEILIYESLSKLLSIKGVKFNKYARLSNQNTIETKPFR